MLDSKQMFGKSSGDTPDFFNWFYLFKQKLFARRFLSPLQCHRVTVFLQPGRGGSKLDNGTFRMVCIGLQNGQTKLSAQEENRE